MGCITWTLFNNKSARQIYFEPDTGLPYTIEVIYKKVYIPLKEIPFVEEKENLSVEDKNMPILPERFRQFARMDGNYLWPYFKNVNYSIPLKAPVYYLLQHFPTWESIKESDEWAQNNWDETKHNLFKECLEWCNTQKGFWGQWPY